MEATSPTAPRRVLYRCRTPTNFLCPCGTVARRLKKQGVEHRVERVAQRRHNRPEIVELTKQERVPVFVDGDEVIHDSKRILQYLEWRYAPEDAPTEGSGLGRPNSERGADTIRTDD